jgi:hypothetical protein
MCNYSNVALCSSTLPFETNLFRATRQSYCSLGTAGDARRGNLRVRLQNAMTIGLELLMRRVVSLYRCTRSSGFLRNESAGKCLTHGTAALRLAKFATPDSKSKEAQSILKEPSTRELQPYHHSVFLPVGGYNQPISADRELLLETEDQLRPHVERLLDLFEPRDSNPFANEHF